MIKRFLRYRREHGYRAAVDEMSGYVRYFPAGMYWAKVLPLFKDWKSVSIADYHLQFTTAANLIYYDWYDDFVSERPILEDFAAHVDSDDIVYDIGANVGIFAVLGSVIADSVHTFEPEPETARYLQANLNQNGGGIVHGFALGAKNETTRLETKGLTGHALKDDGDVEVSLRRGDNVVREIGDRPTVLKIDVEGAELDVIDGLEDTLTEHVRLVYCELHPLQSDGRSDEVVEKLKEAGFEITTLQHRSDQRHIRATR